MSEVLADSILNFWIGPLDANGMPEIKEKSAQWFKKDPTFDSSIQKLYGSLMDMAPMGAYDRWANTPNGRVALIVLLDQFPRNLYRGMARAFYTDAKAQLMTHEALKKGEVDTLPLVYAYFVLMPLMHAENLELQDLGLNEFKKLEARAEGEAAKKLMKSASNFMQQHRDIIAQFGRFPHRNLALRRESTKEELSFLENGGASF